MFAYGHLGLTPSEFMLYSIEEFLFAWYGYQERLARERLNVFLTIRPHVENGITPEKLYHLWTDEPVKIDFDRLAQLQKQAESNWK